MAATSGGLHCTTISRCGFAYDPCRRSRSNNRGDTHNTDGTTLRSTVIVPGSILLVRAPSDTRVQGERMQFLVAVAVETTGRNERAHKVLVVWYVPGMSAQETFKPRVCYVSKADWMGNLSVVPLCLS